MFNDIPVFIDSRLDVYCSEFNNTDIFHDFVYIDDLKSDYEELFKKYDFTHLLFESNSKILPFLKKDEHYKIIYEDKYFVLFEKIKNYNM